MKDPLISVIMSIYSEPLDWLTQSIDSILNQEYRNFEFIIVIDKPDYNNAIDLVNYYSKKDERLIVLFNPHNIGLTKSLNYALSIAKGEYIARMDADDVALPKRLSSQLHSIIETDSDICFSNYNYIDAEDRITLFNDRKRERGPEELFAYNLYAHPTALFKSSLLKLRTPLYNEKYKRSQDYELWSFLFLNGAKFTFDCNVLLNYRISKQQISCQHKVEQYNLMRNIRQDFISSYLLLHGILYNPQGLKTVLNSIDHLLSQLVNNYTVHRNLCVIRYLILLELSKTNIKYCFRYLCHPSKYVKLINNKRVILFESLHLREYPMYNL